jgi:hypothetical protein
MLKIKKSKISTINIWISAFIYSLLLFSYFSYSIFDANGKYIFEAAVFLIILYYTITKDPIGKTLAKGIKKEYILLSFVFIFLIPFLLIGWIKKGSFINSYADFRSNFIFIFSFILSRYILQIDPQKILYLAISTAYISMLYWILQYNSGLLGSKFAVPLFSSVIAVLISIDMKKTILTAASIFSLLFLSAVSFYRQYWIIAILTITVSIIKIYKPNYSSIKYLTSILIFTTILIYLGYDFIWDLFNSSASLYIQSVGKTTDALDLLQGGVASESDNLRFRYFYYIFEKFSELIVPHGLGYKSNSINFDPWFSKYSNASNTIDSLFIYAIYHYGYLVFFPIFLWYILKAIKSAITNGYLIVLFLFLIFLIPCLFDGGQVTVISRAFWFGAFCAYLINPRKYNNDRYLS